MEKSVIRCKAKIKRDRIHFLYPLFSEFSIAFAGLLFRSLFSFFLAGPPEGGTDQPVFTRAYAIPEYQRNIRRFYLYLASVRYGFPIQPDIFNIVVATAASFLSTRRLRAREKGHTPEWPRVLLILPQRNAWIVTPSSSFRFFIDRRDLACGEETPVEGGRQNARRYESCRMKRTLMAPRNFRAFATRAEEIFCDERVEREDEISLWS